MGAFFLTNDRQSLEKAIAWIQAKGLTRYHRFEWGETTLVAFQKIFADAHPNTAQRGDDLLVGFGAYSYEGAFGAAALARILDAVRAGQRPFADVGGHFCMVLRVDGQLRLVSDKTGIYHSFVAHAGPHTYASSSLLSVARALERPRVGRQECLEFLFTQGTYGGRTVFEDVTHLPAGTIFDVDHQLAPLETYYTPTDARLELGPYLEVCRDYLAALRDPTLRFNCDLSGGYDSRTVAALLEMAGVDVSYNTNTNLTDPTDHQVAIELAGAVGRDIHVFDRDYTRVPFEELVERCFRELELCRDAFTAAYSPVFFEEKSRKFDVQLGGYGGELLRDKYSRFTSLDAVIDATYTPAGLRGAPASLTTTYRDTLRAKFEATLAALDERDMKRGVEKLYTYERMRYWGGSRITAYNQYCYRIHPLLDDLLARYTFSFSLDEKADTALQRRIITGASPTLARLRSSYFDKPMVYEDHPAPPGLGGRLRAGQKKLAYQARTALVHVMNVEQLSPLRRWLGRDAHQAHIPSFVDLYTPQGRVADVLGVGLGDLYNRKMVGRYLTLEKALEAAQ